MAIPARWVDPGFHSEGHDDGRQKQSKAFLFCSMCYGLVVGIETC